MKKSKFKRGRSQFSCAIGEHLREYKIYYLLCSISIIFGAVLGVLTVLNTSIEINIECLTDIQLLEFMKSDSSWLSFLFYNTIDCILTLVLIFICIYSVFLAPVTLFILAYKAYYYFINITILLKCLNILGCFNTIIIILPSYILTLLAYSFYACIIMKIAFDFKKRGFVCIGNNLRSNLFKITLWVVLFKLVIIIYQIIVLSIFCNKFIIS